MTTTAPLLTLPIHRDRLPIGGSWAPPDAAGRIEVIGAASEAVIGSVPAGTPVDAGRAAGAAAEALPGWALTPAAERADRLEAIAAELAAREDEIASLIAVEVGMPLRMARQIQARLPVTDLRVAAAELRSMGLEERLDNSLIVREPVGVVVAITPWNYPLHQAAAKVAGALAAGCTVVLKPSEVAPLTAFVLAEAVESAGLPAGILNVVTGTGPVVGEALVAHPLVDMVSFTGSTRAGRRVAELAGASLKRVALELGGKSATIVLEDADLERAVPAAAGSAFLNSGQTCNGLTRLLVPRSRQEEAAGLAAATAARLVLGDPLDETSRLGPLVSAVQRDRVRGYIETGVAEGARLVTGGAEPPASPASGYYVRPTVFADVTPSMRIAQEEIFGPVLAIIPYDDEEEAVAIANGTEYGLAAAVWSADPGRAERVARRLRAGQVDVNGGRFNPRAPFGGVKHSGAGRELGRFGIEEFLVTKAVQLPG